MNKDNELDDLIVYAPEEETEVTQQADIIEEDVREFQKVDISDDYEMDADFAEEEGYEWSSSVLEDDEYDDDDEEFEKKSHKSVWITLLIILVGFFAVFSVKDSEFVKNYSANFQKNISNLLPALFVEEISDEEIANDTTVVVEDDGGNVVAYKEYKEAIVTTDEQTDTEYVFSVKRTYMLPYEGTAEASIVNYQNGIVCGRSNSLSYIDSSGQVQWELQTSIASPMVKCEGRYIVVAENGGNRFSLYKGSQMLFDIESPHSIKSCNLSANGDVVLVLEKEGYKGGISVYNRRGKEVFIWSSGQNDVICADISSASRRVAVGLLNTEGIVYSVIQMFDITKSESGAAVRFDNTVIFDVDYSADVVTGYGDNSMICMTSTGRVIVDRRYDTVELSHKAYDLEGNKALLFDSDNIPIIQTYNRKGTIEDEVVIEELADCIDIKGDYFIYNSGRDVILRKGSANRVNVYTATMDILDLHIIDKNTFVIVHSNSLEIVVIA